MKWIEIYPIDNTTVVHCEHCEQLGTGTQQFHDYCHCINTEQKTND